MRLRRVKRLEPVQASHAGRPKRGVQTVVDSSRGYDDCVRQMATAERGMGGAYVLSVLQELGRIGPDLVVALIIAVALLRLAFGVIAPLLRGVPEPLDNRCFKQCSAKS